MALEPTRAELEALWSRVRNCFLEYRLDELRTLLEVPAGAPVPDRAQARQFAEALPDLTKTEFLKLVRVGDIVAYYGRQQSEVTVVRFRRTDSGWKPCPAPHTMSSYATDEAIDPEALIAREPSLSPLPGDASAPVSSPPGGEAADARPEAEIRKELQATWRRIRDAFAAGRPEEAAGDLLMTEGTRLPSPDEARAYAKEGMPDLVRGRFLKLGWRTDKPQLVGYYAETKVGRFNKTTVSLVVFTRHDGRWKFAPGPTAIENVEGPNISRDNLLKLIDTDPRLAL